MGRIGAAVLEVAVWEDASAERPCPRCAARSGCSELADGEFVRCLSEVSQWPVSGGGWLHRRGDAAHQALRAS
jgi:hypothetical protein